MSPLPLCHTLGAGLEREPFPRDTVLLIVDCGVKMDEHLVQEPKKTCTTKMVHGIQGMISKCNNVDMFNHSGR